MNRALPLLSLCLAVLALAFAVVPRDPIVVSAPPEPEARRGVDLDVELLRLEAEDAARAALAQQQAAGQRVDPEAVRALREQRRETDRTMTGLLDATQRAQYEELRREDRGGGGGNRGQDGERRERTSGQPR